MRHHWILSIRYILRNKYILLNKNLVTLKLLKATLSNDQDEEDLCEHCSRKRKERRTKLKRIKSRTNFETASTTFTEPNTGYIISNCRIKFGFDRRNNR